ncbi:AraC family transcriptional regulator [Pseudoflavitalea sp. X16]|uniref:helix-turn-helix domain-containing protein n=1 Tax=Paraflavitalea devenefica TaxID=2716334 RepID=UPI00141D965D|nr:helix-turn-helix domain-containing protein [Paraflavitalea devenefica]NII26393.1 AraC family transcriptional regulator [Paraflavitalea devenefica]
MERSKTMIPYYTEINDFLASISWPGKTTNPDFYCLRLQPSDEPVQIYRPPFKRSFYFFSLLINSGKIEINYGDETVNDPESYLVFHSPNLVYSFSHNNALEGYVIYFKSECFSYFKPDFHTEFPLFNLLHTNLFKLDRATFQKLAPHFEEVFAAYERSAKDQHIEARVKLLGLLYYLKDFSLERKKEIRLATPQQILLRKYVQLVNNHYIDKRTVQEYADLLSVTANYLSQSVKAVSGKNALSYIAERLVSEAKSLIRYTDFEIAEIAYQLNFSDPANFGKFFKKQAGMSPSEFRNLGK